MQSIEEHYIAYLKEFKFWPSQAQIEILGTVEALELHAEPGWEHWDADRQEIATEQLTYKWTGIDVGKIDGLVGPQTEYAREAYEYWQTHKTLPGWREAETQVTAISRVSALPSVFPKQSDMSGFYGRPGSDIQRQLTRVRCPWELKIAWNLSQTTEHITIHSKCADSLESVLSDVWDMYGDEVFSLGLDLYGGSYNHRRMRGGSSWSTHAFGAAIDWNPSANALRTKAPDATLSHADFDEWWQIWERHGWLSLGRARDFDWMHVQAARLG